MNDFIILGGKYYVRKDNIIMFSATNYIDDYNETDSHTLTLRIVARLKDSYEITVDFRQILKGNYEKKEIPALEADFLTKFIKEFEEINNPAEKKVTI